jgi:hypothetical protein
MMFRRGFIRKPRLFATEASWNSQANISYWG